MLIAWDSLELVLSVKGSSASVDRVYDDKPSSDTLSCCDSAA
jgi:hypothetical protein